MNKLQRLLFVIVAIIFGFVDYTYSQKSININDRQKTTYLKSESIEDASHFEDAEKYRLFGYNPELRELNQSNVKDTILLDFFEDKKYKAVIKKVTVGKDGATAITSRIVGTKFGYCYISISDEGILVSTELPESDEQFDIVKINNRIYLSQTKMSVARKKILEGSEPIIPEGMHDYNNPILNGIQDNNLEGDVIIDVMIVYTKAAKEWANDYSSGIDNVIAIAMEKANEAMQNSGTGITFNLVYKYQTDYKEVNSNEDLYRLCTKDDGYLDEVHTLREQYKADLVVLMPMVSFTGGVAYLLTNENGNKDLCSFSLTRVQQAATGYTLVHELGHNMGCSHSKSQNYQAGPGLYYYSAGWRGPELGGYTTIMSYESGSYYSDHHTYPHIPYFSSPDIVIDGVTIGHSIDGDNVLTLKKTKHVTSQYTIHDNEIFLTISNYSKIYGEADPDLNFSISGRDPKPGDNIQLSRQPGEDAGVYPITCKIYRGNEDVTSEYRITIINTNGFTINPRDLNLSLENSTKVYTGNPIYIDPVVIDGLIGDDKVDISYNYVNNRIETNHALAVGEYSVIAKISGNPNYNEVDISATLTIKYDFRDVVKVKWNNTLMLKVAKITKDGFTVSGCQWYKNDKQIPGANNYSYSVGPDNTDLLDETAIYSVEIKTSKGKIHSTESQIKLKSFDVKVYPNPKKGNEAIYLHADIDEDLLDGATLEIYNISGIRIKTIMVKDYTTPLDLPDNKGTYILKFKGKEGFRKDLKAVVK